MVASANLLFYKFLSCLQYETGGLIHCCLLLWNFALFKTLNTYYLLFNLINKLRSMLPCGAQIKNCQRFVVYMQNVLIVVIGIYIVYECKGLTLLPLSYKNC